MADATAGETTAAGILNPSTKVESRANPTVSFVLPQALRSVGSGRYTVSPINSGTGKLNPAALKANASALVVRYGGEAYLVQFENSESRTTFVKRFRASIHDSGMDVRRKEP